MTRSFDEIRFPVAISRGASGGPERRTDIVMTGSGCEERNSRWADSRRRYNAGFGVKSLSEIYEILNFFEERRGRLYGFRWKDHADFKSCSPNEKISDKDQPIGIGNGSQQQFQLLKNYGTGLRNYQRIITKPVNGTVVIALDGVACTDWSLDSRTGKILFPASKIPAANVHITAGFEFDVPVRFDTDTLTIDLTSFAAGNIAEIPIIEIRPSPS